MQSLYSNAAQRNSGRDISTHNDKQAIVGAAAELPSALRLDVARDDLLAKLSGATTDSLNHSLSTEFSGGTGEENPTMFFYQVLYDSNRAVVVGAFASLERYRDDAEKTGFRIDDPVGGGSLLAVGKQHPAVSDDGRLPAAAETKMRQGRVSLSRWIGYW